LARDNHSTEVVLKSILDTHRRGKKN